MAISRCTGYPTRHNWARSSYTLPSSFREAGPLWSLCLSPFSRPQGGVAEGRGPDNQLRERFPVPCTAPSPSASLIGQSGARCVGSGKRQGVSGGLKAPESANPACEGRCILLASGSVPAPRLRPPERCGRGSAPRTAPRARGLIRPNTKQNLGSEIGYLACSLGSTTIWQFPHL